MPGKILARVLTAVANIYRFEGGERGADQLDVTSPVIRVHDVAPGAGVAASVLFESSLTQISGGAGVDLFTVIDPAATFFTRSPTTQPSAANTIAGRTANNSDVWLLNLEATITVNGGNLTAVRAGYSSPNQGNFISTTLRPRLLYFANGVVANSEVSAADGEHVVFNEAIAGTSGPRKVASIELPVLVNQVLLALTDNAGAAVTAVWALTFMITPRGTHPYETA